MRIDIITAFPGILEAPFKESIIGRAVKNNLVRLYLHDLRDWTRDKHRTIDDSPYGGGAGMIYKVEPLYDCLSDVIKEAGEQRREIFLTSPRGKLFDQDRAVKCSLMDQLIVICGHYKGVDERIKTFFPLEEISIGDYILSGGEIPAAVMADAVIRLLPGALGDADSAFSDSFNDYLLDCEYYTRPEIFRDVGVPEVLLSGNHKKIADWRSGRKESVTKERRPDLYKKYIENIK